MVAVLVCADLHLTDRPRDEYRWGFLPWLARQQVKYQPDYTLILGDLCDQKDRHSASLVNRMVDELIGLKPPIYIIKGNHDCLLDDTEVFTRRGWLHHSNLIDTDQAFGLNIQTGYGEWQRIERVITKTVDEIWTLKTIALDLAVSKNHRLLTRKDKKFRYATPTAQSSKDEIMTSASLNSDGVDLNDDAIRLAAWVLTDGSVEKRHGYITIYQSKHVDLIMKTVRTLGLNPKVVERIREFKNFKQNLPHYEIRFNAKESRELREALDLTHKKRMPFWAPDLSNAQFEIFLDTLILGDGLWYKNRTTKVGILYKTEEFLSWVQGICHLHKYRATLTIDARGDPRLNISQSIFTGRGNLHKKLKKINRPNSKVWCLTVPLGNFLIRRNGKAHLTGNCVDPNNPYFRFLSCIDGLHFVIEPEQLWPGVWGIPHCRTQAELDQACGMVTPNPQAIFTHLTLEGAVAETGTRLTGVRWPLNTIKTWSGDIHRPQRVGPSVTFVGAPYSIRFGDDFEPRVLLLKNWHEHDLHYPCLRKWALQIKSAEALRLDSLDLRAGDHVKVTIELAPEEVVGWVNIKQGVLDVCKELGLEVFGVSLKVINRRKPTGQEQVLAVAPEQVLAAYCAREGVTEEVSQVGIGLLS